MIVCVLLPEFLTTIAKPSLASTYLKKYTTKMVCISGLNDRLVAVATESIPPNDLRSMMVM